ncbi:hypothetical protein CDZ97_11265 [Mameliella alba]|nr:hypothetical protein CDZ97_11265 [Mameliella alba]
MVRMNTSDASAYLAREHGICRTPATLRKIRSTGGGPQFRKAGRSVIYDRSALDAWASGLLGEPVSSTAEASHGRL